MVAASRQPHDLRLGHEQRRHRRGAHRPHRPERHRDPDRRERHREQEHRQQPLVHAGRTPRPQACCSTRPAGSTSRTTRSPPTWSRHRQRRHRRRPRQALAPDAHSTDRGLHAEAPVFLRPRRRACRSTRLLQIRNLPQCELPTRHVPFRIPAETMDRVISPFVRSPGDMKRTTTGVMSSLVHRSWASLNARFSILATERRAPTTRGSMSTSTACTRTPPRPGRSWRDPRRRQRSTTSFRLTGDRGAPAPGAFHAPFGRVPRGDGA